eukprot:scaffold155621_cov42-Prasinocladus_malaysianus.AAC.1
MFLPLSGVRLVRRLWAAGIKLCLPRHLSPLFPILLHIVASVCCFNRLLGPVAASSACLDRPGVRLGITDWQDWGSFCLNAFLVLWLGVVCIAAGARKLIW